MIVVTMYYYFIAFPYIIRIAHSSIHRNTPISDYYFCGMMIRVYFQMIAFSFVKRYCIVMVRLYETLGFYCMFFYNFLLFRM